MEWDDAGPLRYRPPPGHDTRRLHDEADKLVDPADFVARVLMHVPQPRRHRVRYYGAYSNASRGRRQRAAQDAGEAASLGPCSPATGSGQQGGAESCVDARLLRRRWREMIKHVYEVDSLVCPRCGAEMRIIAFILEQEVIDRILRHLARREAERDRSPPGCPDLEAVS